MKELSKSDMKQLYANEKAISNVIGAILVLTVMVAFLGFLQVYSVPVLNKELENNHFNTVVDDLLDMKSILYAGAVYDIPSSAVFHTSLDYPGRTFLMNPSKPSATFTTRYDKQVTITYDGTTERVNSCTFGIEEKYNFFNAPGLVMEHGMIIGDTGSAGYIIDRPLLKDNNMNLLLLRCDNTSTGTGSSVSFNIYPAGSNNITVNNATLSFNTDYPALWNEYLATIGANWTLAGNIVTINYPNQTKIRVIGASLSTPSNLVLLPVTTPALDTTPPASVTNLMNVTYLPLYINWTWADPKDADFDHVMVYIDGAFRSNVGRGVQYYNASYFRPNSTHTISTRTVDTSGNVNATWVNHTASTSDLFTYVFGFLNITGTVANFTAARNANDSANAIFTESNYGTLNANIAGLGKTITTGVQQDAYNPGSLGAIDSNTDVTKPNITAAKQVKTVVYFMGQRENPAALAKGTAYTTSPVSVYLPENGVVVRNAWLELRQLSADTTVTSLTTLNMILNGVDYSVISGTYQKQTGESLVTVARANVTSAFSTFTNPTAFTASVISGNVNTNAQALLLYITYEYEPNSPTRLRTIRYPLGSNTTIIPADSVTNFNYNVSIPESATIRSSWFEITGKLDSASTTDAVIKAMSTGDTSFSTGVSYDMSQRDNYGFRYLFKTTPNFSPNILQALSVQNLNQKVYAMGGEVIVTYEYSRNEPVQQKTVKYFVGQQTAVGLTTTMTDSAAVFIPEQGVKIKSVYAKIRAAVQSGSGTITHTVSGSVGANPASAQAYRVDSTQKSISDYVIIYDMTPNASSLVNNTIVSVSNTFSNNKHGPPGTELYITYEYDPSSPVELKTVEYFAGQSPNQVLTFNGALNPAPEPDTLLWKPYLDYDVVSSANKVFTTTSAIDTSFSSLSVNYNPNEALTAGVLNGDSQGRINPLRNTYAINYSTTQAIADFTGTAKLTYAFRKNYSLNVTYTFTDTTPSPMWQSLSINDFSYADSLANVTVLNATSGRWEPIKTAAFGGGTSPAEHVNVTIGGSGNASSYDAGSGRIMLRYNWTGSLNSTNLGIDLLRVNVNYSVYRLNITTNTTNIPEGSTRQILQLRYNVSGDSFVLQIWNGSYWNSRATLNDTSISTRSIILQPDEMLPYGTMNGSDAAVNTYYMMVRYIDLNASTTKGNLYLDYQRVYTI